MPRLLMNKGWADCCLAKHCIYKWLILLRRSPQCRNHITSYNQHAFLRLGGLCRVRQVCVILLCFGRAFCWLKSSRMRTNLCHCGNEPVAQKLRNRYVPRDSRARLPMILRWFGPSKAVGWRYVGDTLTPHRVTSGRCHCLPITWVAAGMARTRQFDFATSFRWHLDRYGFGNIWPM